MAHAARGELPMPKVLSPLNHQRIERAIAARKGTDALELRDGAVPGLSLRIGPLGHGWSLRVGSSSGRRKTIIGHYPAMSLAEARRAASEAKDATREGKKLDKSIKLIELVDLYEAQECGEMKTWKNGKGTLRLVLKSIWQAYTRNIEFAQVQRAIDEYPSKAQAHKCVVVVRPLFKWAKLRGHVTFDPADLAPPRGAERVRERVLTREELKVLLPEITIGGNEYHNIAALIVFTCCRLREAMDATWGEFDLDAEGGALWTIDPKRRKGGVPLIVPLPVQAVKVLKRVDSTEGRLFKGLNGWSHWQKKINACTGTAGWTRHDLRRTGATVLGDMGTPPHIIEAVLGHTNVGGTSLHSVYNKSRYLTEHRAALEALAAYYERLTLGGN